MSKAKTEGEEWLYHSLMAFNGSGYADMSSPEAFIDSYMAYKVHRGKKKHAAIAHVYRQEMLPILETFLKKTPGAGRKPAERLTTKFNTFRTERAKQTNLL